MVHSAHLNDDRLFDCYVTARAGEPLDPPAAEHLEECLDCGVRYDALVALMDGVREEADAELDELFPAERLAAQQEQILRRLEHVHRSARVISFPGRDPSASGHTSVRVAPRWLAAAAAAGLFIGVAVGGFLGPARFRHGTTRPMQVASGAGSVVTPTPAVRVNSTAPETPDDDTFLMELELALARPHTRELLPLDALTPHVRDNNELAAGPRDIVMDVR
jgi:hypothetical protein